MKKPLVFALLLVLSLTARIVLADESDEAAADAVVSDSNAQAATGAKPDSKAKIVYRKRTAVSFDDAVVEGSTNNPEGVYVVTPPEKQFGSLLKLRPNFHRELMRDALLLK